MSTERRASVRRQPLLLSLTVTVVALSLFALLTTVLAQAQLALPVTAAGGLALQAAPAQGAYAPAAPTGDEPWIEHAAGVVLVKVKPGALQAPAGGMGAQAAQSSTDAVAGLFQSYGVVAAEPLLGGAGPGSLSTSAAGQMADRATTAGSVLDNVYRLHLAPGLDAGQMAIAIAADANVQYAEPDYIARAARVPNDPEYATQWALPKIGAPAAWDVQTGAPSVIIAVIDSGVDMTHPDFGGRLWENDDPVDGIDNDLNGQVDDTHGWNVVAGSGDLSDVNGHGTQVAGVLGAASDNGVGVSGLCWGCKLMVVNAMQASGAANYSDIARAIQYAASNGAQVINLSLGGYADSALLREAVQEAATTAVIVAGAGNDDSASPFYPAAYPAVLAVAATDQNDVQAVFSNYGASVDLAAPGVDIRTTTLAGYATDSGSSLSTAFVSGLAGLVKSQHPAWTAQQVKWQILNTAANIDAANPGKVGQLGRGRIDAAAALSSNPQAQAVVEGYTIDGQAGVRPTPGQSFSLVLTLQNQWLPAQNLQGALTSSDSNVSITDAAGVFGDIAPGQSGSNAGDPFAVTISAGAPYNAQLAFTLNLSGDGGYSLLVPFTIQVRSAVETLGNTQYTQDTIWTNDKTYVLAGSVIVGQGVTLTIQPGTVIKGDPGKFIRVDGTLIAQGTAEQPILFKTNSITDAAWSGLRLSDSAVDSRYDAAGAYAGGSVLQYADISLAEIGINLGTRSLLIADSTFRNNTTAIQSSGGSPRIERNRLIGRYSTGMPGYYPYTAISLNGGKAHIEQNSFSAGYSGVTGSGSPAIVNNTFQDSQDAAISISGSPAILGNRFTGNGGAAISTSSGSPQIDDNVVTGNAGGILGYNLQKVAIGHNLVAGNGSGITIDVQNTSAPYKLALAYNAADDEYLLAWSESDNMGMPQIWVARAAGDGQQVGSVRAVAAGWDPSIAYNPAANEYLIAGSLGAWGGVSIRRLSATGAPLGSETIVTDTYSTQVDVVYQANDPSYLIVYNDGSSGALFAQRVAVDGSLVDGPARVASNVAGLSAIGSLVYNPQQNRSLATFSLDGSWNLYGVWVATRPISTTAFILGNHPEWQRIADASTAYGAGAARYLSVWNTSGNANGSRSVWGSVTDVNGAALISATAIYSQSNAAAFEPQVAFAEDNSRFLVGWVATTPITQALNTLVAAQLVDGDGSPVGSQITVATANSNSFNARSPALIYNSVRHEFLLAWSDDRGGNSAIFGQRLSSAGALLDNAWSPADESVASTNFRLATGEGVRNNTIIDNRSPGISVSGAAAAAVPIHNNNLFGNTGYDISLNSGSPGSQNFTIDAANNFWNVPAASIAGRIRDCTFDENGCGTASATLGKVTYTPALTETVQAAPAFVRAVTMDPNPVGLQAGVITVDFSRAMDTSLPPAASFHDSRRGTTQAFTVTNSAMPGSVKMSKGSNGHLWFAQSATILRYDARQWYTYTLPLEANGSSVTALYAARNGDLWAGICCGNVAALRLRATTWTTYTQQVAPGSALYNVTSIAEDGSGALWFGTYSGAFRYDGSTWTQYTAANGLYGNTVEQVVSDSQGKIWFRTSQPATMTTKITVFDGVTWRTYSDADGWPGNLSPGQLFADSQGRVWASLSSGMDLQTKIIALFEGGSWRFIGSTASDGKLTSSVSAFAESSDGTIWVISGMYGNIAAYHEGVWNSVQSLPSFYVDTMLFDLQDNLWCSSNMGQSAVLWRGHDYPFENGRWVSPTRFQADYTFTPNVPPGSYLVETTGATGSDGMAAYTKSSSAFTVDFGAGVTLDPPSAPVVSAQTDGSLSNLSAAWQNSSSNVDQYRYAIGTAPGARDVVGWTYLAGTSFARNNLSLIQGQTYYVTVQARNTVGLWSTNGVSSAVVGGQGPTPTATPTNTPMATATATAAATATPTLPAGPVIQPDSGGTYTQPIGDLDASLTIPPGAAGEAIAIAMQPVTETPPTGGFAVLGQGFRIEAQTLAGAPVTQFSQPLTLVVHYDDADLGGLDENSLQIHYWNEALQVWVAIPTTVDAAANTLTIRLDHLTLFAVLQAPARQPEVFLPLVNR